jgi:hypothetical protein
MARYTSPYNKNTTGHFPQAIWQKVRLSLFNADRGDTDSVLNLIPAEKVVAVKKPRAVRTGGNPGKWLILPIIVDIYWHSLLDMCFGSCCRGWEMRDDTIFGLFLWAMITHLARRMKVVCFASDGYTAMIARAKLQRQA